jgi:hypothetical protein
VSASTGDKYNIYQRGMTARGVEPLIGTSACLCVCVCVWCWCMRHDGGVDSWFVCT